LAVANAYNDRVQISGPDGRFLRAWGGPFALNIPGDFNSWFRVATAVAVGPEGNIFVADFYNDRIQKFAPDEAFLTTFGAQDDGRLERPTDIAVDAAGKVYVVDFGNNQMKKFVPVAKLSSFS